MTSIVLFSCIYSSSRYTHGIPDDDYKIVETLKIKVISIFFVTIVVYLIKILSGYRNFRSKYKYCNEAAKLFEFNVGENVSPILIFHANAGMSLTYLKL